MKCGPDGCPILAFSDLTPAEQRMQRQRTAEKMSGQGFTQAQIAKALGVGQKTVSRDLETLVTVTNVKGQGKDTLGRKRSTGRPKGSGGKANKLQPSRRKNMTPDAVVAAQSILDNDKSYSQVEKETGFSNIVLRAAVAREEGRREARAEPEIDPKTLALSAQKKFDIAIRQYKRKLDAEFVDRVAAECRKQIDEMWLPNCQERLDEAERVLKSRGPRGAMPRATYRIILSCLHADSRKSVSDERLNEAFHAFAKLEVVLCSEAEMPTPSIPFPRTRAEWMTQKAKVAAARKTKRSNGKELSR